MTLYHDKLRELKNKPSLDFAKIPISEKTVLLRVIDDSDENIELLTKWRNQFWDAFPEKFTATVSGTKKWLKEQVFEKDDRILFMILLNNQKIGHIGTYRYDKDRNSAEIDNVVRAVRSDTPGVMEKVTNHLIVWLLNDLGLDKVRLKVFSDNYKAINLYERCGMLTVGMIPLKRVYTNHGWKWEEIELRNEQYADRYFSVMEVGKKTARG